MDRNFALEFVRVTEAASIAAAREMGKGDEKLADHMAVEAMRKVMNSVDFDGTVQIGEGERDEAPMLYIGEKVGRGGSVALDIALDPLEGTTICAKGGPNALSVLAIAEQGNFLNAPDVYMKKIAVGPEAAGVIDLEATPTENLKKIAEAKGCSVSDLTAIVLDRPRHKELISEIREAGARIYLIGDGDVQAAIAAGMPNTGVDVLMGVGGAPEGVIAAAALKCIGGDFQGQLIFNKKGHDNMLDQAQIDRAKEQMGIENPDRVYKINDLAKGHVMFCATGVTDGSMLKGVKFLGSERATTHSLVMRSETGTVRHIEAIHDFTKKTN
jgi:fructose-1,6-bisphosphatase class II